MEKRWKIIEADKNKVDCFKNFFIHQFCLYVISLFNGALILSKKQKIISGLNFLIYMILF